MSNHSMLHKMVWSVLSDRNSNDGDQLIALSDIGSKNADSVDLSRLVTPMLLDYAHLSDVAPDSGAEMEANLSFNVINAFADANWLLESEMISRLEPSAGFDEPEPILNNSVVVWEGDEESAPIHLQTEETVQYGWVGGTVFDDAEQSAVDLLLLASHAADEPLVFADGAEILSTADLLNEDAESPSVFEIDTEEYCYMSVSTVLVDELEKNISLQLEIL
ncbi:hypothetical protein OA57_02650 [Chelonobacter oris]|uniref:Uncharacterized protein n=1 Tax=Chelonobacter oris TaxID=505317 RepID=A0A0A3ATT1_9PAST|nr:hypothetical protein [Chelonobacter oris]KGQ71147.1 hypothetical protein OA57_02650 [Chelonobacter oris]